MKSSVKLRFKFHRGSHPRPADHLASRNRLLQFRKVTWCINTHSYLDRHFTMDYSPAVFALTPTGVTLKIYR